MKIRVVAIIGFVFIACFDTAAQAPSSSIVGRVLHPDGSFVGDAPIRARSEAGVDARTRSFDDGRYALEGLPAGLYTLSVVMPCCEFAPYRRDGVAVGATERVDLDIHLIMVELGVEGDDPATISAEIRDRQLIPDLPVPRNVEGRPDLSGIWLIVRDSYPEPANALPWAQDVSEQRIANSLRDHPHTRCLPGSPPVEGFTAPFMGKFVQTPELLLILSEGIPGFRQIFLDGRDHPASANPSWMGHSLGRWEGDTLVVDTVGFNSRGWTQTYPRTEMLRTEERYTRVDYGHLEVRVTFDDPEVFVEPWVWNMTWNYAPQEELLEFVCENNKWAPVE